MFAILRRSVAWLCAFGAVVCFGAIFSRSIQGATGNAPVIVSQPVNRTVHAGSNAVLAVEATGAQPLNFQWRFRNRPVPGATSSTLRFEPAVFSNSGPYTVVVSNTFGSVTSRVAYLEVLAPPRILEPPRSQTRVAGETVYFRVLAEGTAPLRYQWRFDGNVLPNQTNSTLIIQSVSTDHIGKYGVLVSNRLGSAVSPTAALNVIIPPFITSQPKSREVNVGETATFAVEAGGTLPLSFQWLRNGVAIPGATEPSYTIQGVQPSDGASYRVVVANAGGSVQSDSAFLRVNVPVRELADDFRERQLLRETEGLFRSSNRGATAESGEPRHAGKFGGKSVWFAWTSDVPGILTVRTRGSHFDTLLAAYTGEEVDALTEVASDEDSGGFLNSEISLNVTGKMPYAIAIDGFNGYEGELLVEWSFEPTDEKLPIILEQPMDQVVKLGGDARFFVRVEQPNAMYQWFFNGEPIRGALEAVLTLRAAREEQAGLYYVMVTDGRRTVLSRAATLQFNAIGPDNSVQPFFARDKFGDVVNREQFFGFAARAFAVEEPGMAAMAAGGGVVHGYTGTQLFSTVGAVKDEGEPDHCGVPGGASYWYEHVSPSSGQMFMNTDGSSFDTVLAIYTATGPTYADLIAVACDNNSGSNGLTSRVSFPARAGETYYVVVDGVNGASGNVRLSYKLLVPLVLSEAAQTNSFRFHITATPFVPFTIERSADLEEWLPVITTNTASGFYEYLDTNSAVIRYFRVLQVP